MRVLFAGPSLYGVSADLSGIDTRGPAKQGDIARAVLEGASVIGLVDGYFDAVAAPWHKEILFALAEGVALFGASSMGALRAAECAYFGMRPIGTIAQAYCSGELDDDAAVALSHGPAELGYPPLTEPLVEVQPTLERLRALGHLSGREHDDLWARARGLYFKDRSDTALFAHLDEGSRLAAYREHRTHRKADDALLLIAALRDCPLVRVPRNDVPQPASLFAKEVLPALATVLQHETTA